MEVHIRRRHSDMSLALNGPYGAFDARSFGSPIYNLKPSYSPNNVVFHSGESVSGQTNRDDRQEDVMDHIISFLSKQVQIKELTSKLAPPYYPVSYPQQFYYPSTLGHIPKPKPKPQLISLRGSVCDKCLTIDTFPTFLYEDGTVKEIHNHSCSEDRLLGLERRYKHGFFIVVLHRLLLKILAINVVMCNKSQAKISLSFMKCDDFSSSNTAIYSSGSLNCPIRVLDAYPSEYRWINQIKNSQKREGIIELETAEELLSFLQISINSTIVKLKIKHDSSLSPSSENWDSYLVGLNLPEPNLERVTKPFAPKFRNWKYL